MALGSSELQLLLRLKCDSMIVKPGAVMEIGAQQLSNTFLREREKIAELGRLFGAAKPFEVPAPTETVLAHGSYEALLPEAPRSRPFWEWLGFLYASLDIDGSPDALPVDLNYDAVPAEARNRFNLIVNAGTTEHVANQANAFKIIHDLTALGGIMIHNLPAQGMMRHGLVNYNPKFFWMLSRSNGYPILFFDYISGGETYALPDEVREKLSVPRDMNGCALSDATILVAMQKRFDTEFVAPLDVNTGTQIGDPAVRERYWTVFESGAWADIEQKHEQRLKAIASEERIRERRERLQRTIAAVSPGIGIGRGIRRLAKSLRGR